MKKYLFGWLFLVIAFTSTAQTNEVKNVIIMIGDGMSLPQIYSGLTMNGGGLNLERAHYIGLSRTNSSDNYTTDSAAGGTAIACGVKTKNGAIGVDAAGEKVPSMIALAEEKGKKTGIVVTSEVTHATPASFYAHQPSRKMGEEIAADLLNLEVDVVYGGGRDHFMKRADHRDLISELKNKGYQYIDQTTELKNVSSDKVIGLFNDSHMPSVENNRGSMLPDCVSSALVLLDKNNQNGFLLMVEGSQIDFESHANKGNNVASEMIDFDNAVKVAFDFADNNPGTLVIVTADHETGGMTIQGGNFEDKSVKTAFSTKSHTAIPVPVFAYGTGADQMAGFYHNTEIYNRVCELLNLKN